MIEPDQLVVGDTYFMLTCPDASLTTPIIITYRFLGKNPEGVQQNEPGSHYYFRCLPPFRSGHEEDEEVRALAAVWLDVFPGAFTGWGEIVPSNFTDEQVRGLSTLDGLIAELAAIRRRKA